MLCCIACCPEGDDVGLGSERLMYALWHACTDVTPAANNDSKELA